MEIRLVPGCRGRHARIRALGGLCLRLCRRTPGIVVWLVAGHCGSCGGFRRLFGSGTRVLISSGDVGKEKETPNIGKRAADRIIVAIVN